MLIFFCILAIVLTALIFYVFLQLSTIITERDHEKVIDFRRISCRACAGQEGFHGIRLQSEKFISLILFTAPAPGGDFPPIGEGMEERYRMTHYLRYCCAMLFALFSFLLATPQRAQAQTREAYVSQSADKTTLTFYYDALRSTRTGTTWGIGEMQKERERTYQQERERTYPAWAGTWKVINNTTTRVVFDASFRDFRPTTTAAWFYHCKALTKIEGLEYLNTAEVKDMRGMFAACEALTSLDLKSFKTQNVTDMGFMFAACEALTSIDLRNFDTQNVTDMSWMFKDCSALTSLDLKNFNTQNVTNMGSMFDGCWALTSLDLKNFNTQNVTNMEGLFANCEALISLDLINFDTQNVTNMKWMFSSCQALTSIDLKHFNTQNVTDMSGMFKGCSGLTSLDLKNFDTQSVTDMSWMFTDCMALTSLDLKNFDTQNVIDMGFMFSGCAALTTINSNTAWQCRESENMFAGCTKLKGAVAYNKKKVDAKMANPETGYFTAKPTTAKRNRRSAAHLPAASKRGARKHLPAGV